LRDVSLLHSHIFFVAVAVSVSVSYLAVVNIAGVTRSVVGHFRSAQPVSRRPGEIIHQALKITGRRSDQYWTAALLFVASLLILITFGRRDAWTDMSVFQYTSIAAALSTILSFGILKLIQLARYRRRLGNMLDAHVSVAQRLAEAQQRGNRVFHSVPVGKTIIDNVIVGRNGVYTVQLFPPPDRQCKSVRADATGLYFQPGNFLCEFRKHKHEVTLLTRALTQCVGSQITVLPVIVVPGCVIEPTSLERPLLVSMESCTAFIGWKNPDAYLMEEDIVEINRWLSTLESAKPSRSLHALTEILDARIDRPKFV
jgi:hypothetical protein